MNMKRIFYILLTVLVVTSCGVAGKKGANDKIVIGLGHSGIPDATRECWFKAVTDAGAELVEFPNYAHNDEEARQLVAGVDAVIIPGSGSKDSSGRKYSDFRLIKAALESGKPLLGVCEGHQRINQYLGGKIQKVSDVFPNTTIKHKIYDANGKNIGANMEAHPIIIDRKSKLYKILGKRDTVMVNTSHNWCTGVMSDSVKVTAIAPDGLVEAYEMRNVMGVQFHPEYLYCRVGKKDFLAIFHNLIEEARTAKNKKK